jgi:hypothetical protein
VSAAAIGAAAIAAAAAAARIIGVYFSVFRIFPSVATQ